jgi:hypothetical protein
MEYFKTNYNPPDIKEIKAINNTYSQSEIINLLNIDNISSTRYSMLLVLKEYPEIVQAIRTEQEQLTLLTSASTQYINYNIFCIFYKIQCLFYKQFIKYFGKLALIDRTIINNYNKYYNNKLKLLNIYNEILDLKANIPKYIHNPNKIFYNILLINNVYNKGGRKISGINYKQVTPKQGYRTELSQIIKHLKNPSSKLEEHSAFNTKYTYLIGNAGENRSDRRNFTEFIKDIYNKYDSTTKEYMGGSLRESYNNYYKLKKKYTTKLKNLHMKINDYNSIVANNVDIKSIQKFDIQLKEKLDTISQHKLYGYTISQHKLYGYTVILNSIYNKYNIENLTDVDFLNKLKTVDFSQKLKTDDFSQKLIEILNIHTFEEYNSNIGKLSDIFKMYTIYKNTNDTGDRPLPTWSSTYYISIDEYIQNIHTKLLEKYSDNIQYQFEEIKNTLYDKNALISQFTSDKIIKEFNIDEYNTVYKYLKDLTNIHNDMCDYIMFAKSLEKDYNSLLSND